MKKNWLIVLFSILVITFFTTAQVMAAGPGGNNPHRHTHTPVAKKTAPQGKGPAVPHGKPSNFTGTIQTVTATSLVLTLRDGSSKTFVLDENTIVKVPTLGRSATVSALLAGQKAGVHAVENNGTLIARMVLVIPGKPVHMHRVGVVTAYTAGQSITIQATDGNTYTFVVNSTTRVLPSGSASSLKVGSYVTIIMPRDVTGGTATAAGIVVHPAD